MRMIRVALPSVLVLPLTQRLKVSMAVIPPLITSSTLTGDPLFNWTQIAEVARKLERGIPQSESCSDPVLCFPALQGGAFLMLGNEPVARVESKSCVTLKEGEMGKRRSYEIMKAIKHGEKICTGSATSLSLCISPVPRTPGCYNVDNVGLRYVEVEE